MAVFIQVCGRGSVLEVFCFESREVLYAKPKLCELHRFSEYFPYMPLPVKNRKRICRLQKMSGALSRHAAGNSISISWHFQNSYRQQTSNNSDVFLIMLTLSSLSSFCILPFPNNLETLGMNPIPGLVSRCEFHGIIALLSFAVSVRQSGIRVEKWHSTGK